MEDMRSLGVGLYLHTQGIDSSTAGGKALLQMAGVFAEFEREILHERIHAGLQRARKQGKRLGRPPLPPIMHDRIRRLREQGVSVRKIARKLGIAMSSVQRV